MEKKKVAVIFGGRSGEHEVSIRSARGVMEALDHERWEAIPFGVTRPGNWMTVDETRRVLASGDRKFSTGGAPLLLSEALRDLAACDIAFPLIHGTFGEDGTIQGFLELAGLPYAGCAVAASAIGMDKALMKALFREAGVRQAKYAVVRSWDVEENATRATLYIEQTIGYPCFVKPANGGSSVGITKVRSREDIGRAFTEAFRYDDKAIVEQAITGQEVEVSVLGNEHPEASIAGEIAPDREFYDFDSKYSSTSRTALHVPARVPEAVAAKVRELAVRMYQVMGCEGYARVDFFVTADGDILANEINTIPGFTSISMFPKLWEASGLPYRALLTRILELGLEREARRSKR
jgi:D-alanine-D-alanine ligase